MGVGRRWRPPGRSAPRLDLHLSPHWGVGRLAFRDQQEAEEQERERLAYVAATRARHLLVLGWMEAKGQEANPLAGWLLTQGQRRELPVPSLIHLCRFRPIETRRPRAAGCRSHNTSS